MPVPFKSSCASDAGHLLPAQTKMAPVGRAYFVSVPERGLEPPPLAGPAPKAGVYTNFTTPALRYTINQNIKSCLALRDHKSILLVSKNAFLVVTDI